MLELQSGEHPQGHMPAKGSKQQRASEEGVNNKAARNRVPVKMAKALGLAMKKAWQQ